MIKAWFKKKKENRIVNNFTNAVENTMVIFTEKNGTDYSDRLMDDDDYNKLVEENKILRTRNNVLIRDLAYVEEEREDAEGKVEALNNIIAADEEIIDELHAHINVLEKYIDSTLMYQVYRNAWDGKI